MTHIFLLYTVKPVFIGHLKIDKNNGLNGKWKLNEGRTY